LSYFHDSKRLAPKGALASNLRYLHRAIRRALGRDQHQIKGRKQLYASSLAFKSVLALVPALAILMAVLSADLFSQKREQVLDQIVDVLYPVETSTAVAGLDPTEKKNLQELNQVGKQQIRRSVQKFVVHARRAGLAGLIGFMVVVFLLLRDVEGAFNFLWGVEKGRPVLSQVARQTLFLLGAPLLASLAITLKGWLKMLLPARALWEGWGISVLMPFLVLWALCALMYHWVPNIRVDRRAAIGSGFLVALLLEAAQNAMSWYAIHVLASSRVYGALWVIPMILIWLYLSWAIILFGAEVCYFMHQDRMEAKR